MVPYGEMLEGSLFFSKQIMSYSAFRQLSCVLVTIGL